jgi:uncharacterized protein (DUF697 family)
MGNALTQDTILKTLDWAYAKAINGMPGIDSAEEMAQDYLKGDRPLAEKVNSLIRWQNSKAATSGFIAGLGGAITMPISIPANVASVLYVQVRMIAAIAKMGGHDLRDDRVKTMVYVCLCGNAAKDILKELGIVAGKKFAENAIKKISAKTLIAINQKVGFRLITKFGQTGLINLGKMVPVLGGVIGGTFDATSTNIIGNVARNKFVAG